MGKGILMKRLCLIVIALAGVITVSAEDLPQNLAEDGIAQKEINLGSEAAAAIKSFICRILLKH